MAIKNADFIILNLIDNEGKLFRNYKDGKSYTNGMLDDYANVIRSFIYLYQFTFDEKWFDHARSLLDYTLKHFYNPESGMFYLASDLSLDLITRQYEIPDQVIPSSNSVMALNLYFLGKLFDDPEYERMSGKMLSNVHSHLVNSGIYFANWSKLLILFVSSPYEVAILGEKCLELNKKLQERFIPDVILCGGEEEGNIPLLKNKLIEKQTNIYICRDRTCGLPLHDLSEALNLLGKS